MSTQPIASGPQISNEMVTAYRDAWAALPVPSTPAERVRAGLAAVAPLLSLGQAAEQIEDDLHHWVCCDPNTALCGTDVSGQPWLIKDTTCPMCPEARCPICGELA